MSVSKSDMGNPIAHDDLADVAVDGAPPPPDSREAVAEAMAKCDCPEWDMSQHPPESLGRRLFRAKADALIAALSRGGFRVVREEEDDAAWQQLEQANERLNAELDCARTALEDFGVSVAADDGSVRAVAQMVEVLAGRMVREEAWRPIETAPTDAMVWVWVQSSDPRPSSFAAMRIRPHRSWGPSHFRPTHWQPIVKPEGPR